VDAVHFFRDEDNQFRWHRKSENGEIVSESGEGYERLQSAVDQAVTQFGDDVRYVYETADDPPPPS
jgi:uncharacterized protein YegP (UPF0339 family)